MFSQASSINDITGEDIIDLRNLATWLRDLSDRDLYEPEDYPEDDVVEAVSALGLFLAELGYAGYDTWEKVADKLQEIGGNYEPTLIRAAYFTEYTKEFAEDCGYISRDLKWPLNNIDWQDAADDLKVEYSSADLAGVEYLIRSF